MPFDEAVASHAAGDFMTALHKRTKEFAALAPSDARYPGLAGVIALDYERLGNTESALRYVDIAATTVAPYNEPVSESMRRCAERPSVHINIGTVLLRAASRARLHGSDPQERRYTAGAQFFLHEARAALQEQYDDDSVIHQHEINLMARLAMNEAVQRRPKSAFLCSLAAVVLAPLSESPTFVDHTSGFTTRVKLVSKGKALGRGLNALAIATTALPKIRDTKTVTRLRDRLILAPAVGA